MADDRINVFTLGLGGVNVDDDPILTEDNQTLQSQNATYDPTAQRGGGLTKRPGLDRFNYTPFSGSVLGGIEASFIGTAGAPTGGGGTGSSGSSGSSQLRALIWNKGVPLFGGKKLIIIGRMDNGVTGASGAGWYVTSKGFNDIGLLLTGTQGPLQQAANTPGTPGSVYALSRLSGGPGMVTLGQAPNGDVSGGQISCKTSGLFAQTAGAFYYPARMDASVTTGPLVAPTSGSTSGGNYPVIRLNDGMTDVPVATIPLGPSWGVLPYGVTRAMQVAGLTTRFNDWSKIYISVYDRVSGPEVADNSAGRVFEYVTGTGVLNTVYNSDPLYVGSTGNHASISGTLSPLLSGGGIPVWFGGVRQSTGGSGAVNALITGPSGNFSFNTYGFNNWQGWEPGYVAKSDVTCMAVYKNTLFVGHANQAATPAFAVINATALAGSTATLTANPQLTATGGSAVASNHFSSMAIFLGKLYVSYWNRTQIAKIYCFDGTTWTTVYTSGTFTGDQVPINLQTDSDGDILYAFGGVDLAPAAIFMTSVDGTTWVNKSANLTNDLTASGGGNFSNSMPMNILVDCAQY